MDKKNPRQLLSVLLPTTLAIAVEKFTTEELVMLAKDAEEIEQRLAAQQQGNEALSRDLEALKAQNAEHLTEINALQSGLVETEAKLEGVLVQVQNLEKEKEDLKPYIEYAEKLKSLGRALPSEDFTTEKEDYFSKLPDGHPDKLRAENLKKTGKK